MTTRVDPVHPPYPRPVATGSPFSVCSRYVVARPGNARVTAAVRLETFSFS